MTEPVRYNLRLVRELLGLKDADFAPLSGLSRSSIYSLERGQTQPRLTTLYQIALSAGVHPTVLIMSAGEIEGWGRLLSRCAPLQGVLDQLPFGSTIDEMNRMFDDEHPEGRDPADWMAELEDAIRQVARRAARSSTSAVIGAAIGRQWAGLYGATVVAHVAHAFAPLIEQENLEGFRLPGPFIEERLRFHLPEDFDF
jgi:transcriptional regulator with XRE-family HTH domain